MPPFPVGKLPHELLARLLDEYKPHDPRVILGPGVGLDCAVVDFNGLCLVMKSDPITFTSRELGWYAVHVNANDVATTGAPPKWFLATLLLPEQGCEESLVRSIFQEIGDACRSVGAQLLGGHTEVTSGLERPIICGTMLGEVPRDRLITPRGARPGDRILLTKGVPIEATSILAHEFRDRLQSLPPSLLDRARGYLHDPGISVVPEALAAAEAGGVTAMHDPTEGGLASGLWELARASNTGIVVDFEAIPIPHESLEVCSALGLDPLAAIASGALLLTVRAVKSARVLEAIASRGIRVCEIGRVVEGADVAMRRKGKTELLVWPERDALATLFP
jgi:hydrogenase maturation factor